MSRKLKFKEKGQRTDRLRQHREFTAVYRQFACIGAECKAFDADEIADVEQFLEYRVVERRIAFGTDVIAADVDLDAARMVLQLEKRRAAHDATRHDTSCNADILVFIRLRVEMFSDFAGGGRHLVSGCGIGFDAQFAQRLQRLAPQLFLFAEFGDHYVVILFVAIVRQS